MRTLLQQLVFGILDETQKLTQHTRRVWACAAMALLGCGPAWGQAYPSKPIRMIVPYPAGGPTDTTARLISPRMSEALGRQIVIENRLHAEVVKALAVPDIQAKFVDSGAQIGGMPPAEFAKFFRSEVEKWSRAVKLAGVKVE